MPLINDAIDLKIGNTQVLSAFMNGVLVWPPLGSGNDPLSAAEPPPAAIKAAFSYYDVFAPVEYEWGTGSGRMRDVETCLELVSYSLPASGYASASYWGAAPYNANCNTQEWNPSGYGYNGDPAWQIEITYTMTPTYSGWEAFAGTTCLAMFDGYEFTGNGESVDIYSPFGVWDWSAGRGDHNPGDTIEVTEVVNLTADCPPDECQSLYNEFIDLLNIDGGDMSCSVDEAIPAVQSTYVQTITSVNKTDYTQLQLDDFTAALSARYMQLNPTATEINIEIT